MGVARASRYVQSRRALTVAKVFLGCLLGSLRSGCKAEPGSSRNFGVGFNVSHFGKGG